jgi:cell division protein FtsA
LPSDSAKGQTISLTNELGLELKRINHEHLQRIMALRLEEIFELIAQDLERAGLVEYLRAGVLLCGGAARVPGLVKLAENVFQMNVAAGHACAISGLTAALDQPEFAAAIGLVRFGSLKTRCRERRSFIPRGLKDAFGKLIQRG